MLDYWTSKVACEILMTMCDSTSIVILLNKDFELFQMEDDEKFDKFCARFSNLVNSLCNLARSIEDEKKIEKFLANLPPNFKENVTILEFYKPDGLKINELIGDLQAYEILHFLSWKLQLASEKGKSIALNSIK